MIIFRKKVTGLTELALQRFVLRARRKVNLTGQVNVLVTGNHEMAALNRQFRKKNYPTDVLSFPAEGISKFAGDVAISAEIASGNAKRLGHARAEEIKILTLHGLLHLAGYDHESDGGEMARAEEKFRKALNLNTGLIERESVAKRTVLPNQPSRNRTRATQRRAR